MDCYKPNQTNSIVFYKACEPPINVNSCAILERVFKIIKDGNPG